MNEFKTILARLKQIIGKPGVKVCDKDIASALQIKPDTLASYKRRDKPPYQAILIYCHENRLDVRKVLFDEFEPIVSYPTHASVEVDKVQVRYFRTLEMYSLYLNQLKKSLFIIHKV